MTLHCLVQKAVDNLLERTLFGTFLYMKEFDLIYWEFSSSMSLYDLRMEIVFIIQMCLNVCSYTEAV